MAAAAAVTVPPSNSMASDLFMRQGYHVYTMNASPLTFYVCKLSYMETLKDRIEHLMKVMSWDVKDVSEVAGVSSSAVSQWLGKGSKQIHSIQIAPATKLGKATGFNPLWISKGEAPKVLETSPGPGPTIGGSVPLISDVQAGSFTEHVDNFHPGDGGMEMIPTTVPINRYTFALRVAGDSMEPEFHEGMILIIEPELDPMPGDYVVAKDSQGATTFKQLTKDGQDWYLKPLNPRYPIKPLGESRVIGVLRAVERRYR